MNKEFIPYEQALALKELGFNEPCLSYYFSDGTFNDASEEDDILYPGDPRFHSDTNSSLSEYLEDELKYNAIAAPLYQQAFRWFREKYGLYHVINMFGDLDKPQYSYIVSGKTMGNPAHMWHYEDKDSHEETELACLKKLIEIVKNK
jgi:hypothetical protein